MKDLHARTHVFTIVVADESFDFDVEPIDQYETRTDHKISQENPSIDSLLQGRDQYDDSAIYYVTPDLKDAIYSLEALVKAEEVGAWDAAGAIMAFIEAFTGVTTK